MRNCLRLQFSRSGNRTGSRRKGMVYPSLPSILDWRNTSRRCADLLASLKKASPVAGCHHLIPIGQAYCYKAINDVYRCGRGQTKRQEGERRVRKRSWLSCDRHGSLFAVFVIVCLPYLQMTKKERQLYQTHCGNKRELSLPASTAQRSFKHERLQYLCRSMADIDAIPLTSSHPWYANSLRSLHNVQGLNRHAPRCRLAKI
jgi:hypothetical protein